MKKLNLIRMRWLKSWRSCVKVVDYGFVEFVVDYCLFSMRNGKLRSVV